MAKETDFQHPPRGHVAVLFYDIANHRFQVVQGDDVDTAIPATAKAPLASTLAHGYDGSAWRKQGLVWGYGDRYEEKIDLTVTVAGNNNLDSTAVPAGFVYVLQAWSMKNRDKDGIMEFHVVPPSGARAIDRNALPGANVPVTCGPVPFVLKKDDFVRSHFKACDVDDRLEVQLWGYKMRIDM